MANDVAPLTDAEREELEQLRAEKAAREEAERARAERAELEQLRKESATAVREPAPVPQTPVAQREPTEEELRQARARERGRALMEPGDDLAMPLGQRIVLVGIALIVIAIVAVTLFGRG